ncbi:RHS repeat-associated core domain-containing protein [Pseudomonas mosselii]|uniref:RHS repeat-associated core domain-containing protein n=1 Tax=Pseudomonas mosselii TaxID=78327 RepID=UPI000C12CE2C|nr:RHS repeat-associated core domain-containing protein [Pseudomonas mosselii]
MTQDHKASRATNLLITDGPGSVLHELSSHIYYTYTPFGYDVPRANGRPLLGFNSQLFELSCTYLLGSGYRAYNPTIMRFNSPDSLSPFNGGGTNTYAYCSNDPINNVDPSGHINRPLQQANATYKAKNGLLSKAVTIEGQEQFVPAPSGAVAILKKGITESQEVLGTLIKQKKDLELSAQPCLDTISNSEAIIARNENSLAQYPIPERGARDRAAIQQMHLRLNASSALERGRIKVANNAPEIINLHNIKIAINTINNDIYTAQNTMALGRTST